LSFKTLPDATAVHLLRDVDVSVFNGDLHYVAVRHGNFDARLGVPEKTSTFKSNMYKERPSRTLAFNFKFKGVIKGSNVIAGVFILSCHQIKVGQVEREE
jgi:hypothetical protein